MFGKELYVGQIDEVVTDLGRKNKSLRALAKYTNRTDPSTWESGNRAKPRERESTS